MPDDYVRAVRRWADQNASLLAFDEIQAGFGRTGKWFGFEHYGAEADLICLGKGMTSSMPMSAVAGRAEILDRPDHGEMSSTHTGNPLCCAALIANIEAISRGNLLDRSRELGLLVRETVDRLKQRHPDRIRWGSGKGLAWAIYIHRKGNDSLDIDCAERITTDCMKNGLLMMQTGRGTLKLAPPLCISKKALREGLSVIEQSVARAVLTDQ
jgi:4-aminobutyrate aminotransferase-like enzyme